MENKKPTEVEDRFPITLLHFLGEIVGGGPCFSLVTPHLPLPLAWWMKRLRKMAADVATKGTT